MPSKMFKTADVHMGVIPMETLLTWANSISRFVEVTAPEHLASAREEWKKRVRSKGVPERHIKGMDSELIEEALKMNILVLFSRAVVRAIFSGKTLEKAIQETINNDEWVQETVETAVKMNAESAVEASIMARLAGPIAGMFFKHPGPDNDTDTDTDDGNG